MSATDTTYNSDLGTYDLFQQLEQQFDRYISTSTWRAELHGQQFEITADFVQRIIYPKMKLEAEMLAEKIATNAANRIERWESVTSTTLIHRIIEILFSNGIRRGSIPSEAEDLHRRETLIKNGLSSPDGLRFSILMLPCRDQNKAKNDGYLPDLGEIITLLQLWVIIKAMLMATENFAQMLISIFSKVAASAKTITDVQNTIDTILRRKKTIVAYSQHQRKRRRIDVLREELMNDYDVTDAHKAELLLHELARCNCTIAWFLQSIEEVVQVQTKSIRLFIVQDARRYACYDTDSDEHIQAYSKCLNEIAVQFNIHEHIILTSHEKLEQEYTNRQNLQIFIKQRAEMYREKFEELAQPFFQAKFDLLRCTTRESFLTLVGKLSSNNSIAQMIEPVLHSRYHPELADAHLSSSDELKMLAQIYQPQIGDANRESLRQKVLFSSLINAIKYICSYESQTATKNKYQLDDIQFLLPNTIRLSIHNKSSNCEQFLIKCGPNLHRQPWHGTVGLRLRKNTGQHSMSFEIRLSFEYKVDHYIPIFVKKDLTTNNNHHDYLSALACIDQPIVWIHSDLVRTYDNDLNRIFDRNNQIRLI